MCLFMCRGSWWSCCCRLDGIVFAPRWLFGRSGGSMYVFKERKQEERYKETLLRCVFITVCTYACVYVSVSLCELSFQWGEGTKCLAPICLIKLVEEPAATKNNAGPNRDYSLSILYRKLWVHSTKLIKQQHEAWSCMVCLLTHTHTPALLLYTCWHMH